MSISEPFRYRNDSFQSDIISSDIGITDVDVGCRISDIAETKIDVDAHLCGNRKKCEEILEGKRHVIVIELHQKPVLGRRTTGHRHTVEVTRLSLFSSQ
jgi:hypothetical protein